MKDYSQILPLEQPTLHTREISISTCRLDQDHVQIRAELRDTRPMVESEGIGDFPIHGMAVRLKVRRDLMITDAQFESPKAPYKECSRFAIPASKLVGVSAGKGFTKRIYELYEGTKSCSHIVTLLVNLAPAIRQGMAFAMFFPDEEKSLKLATLLPTVRQMANFIKDSCMVWASGSPVQKDIAQGDVRDLPQRIYPRFKQKP